MDRGEDEPGGELGAPPEPDALSRAVRRSRVAKNLFAVDEPVRIGRYQLLERVGAGGIGVVWGAWDPELERRVAIKVIKPTLAAARERILAEGQALAKLSHPNVVPVFDVGVVEDHVYLVMEWVRGKTLRAYCAAVTAVRDIVAVYRAAGAGLAAAHAAGLVHRDFKPENAMVGDDGRVRVLDFGLARGEARDEEDRDERVTRGAGTPRYMAPEQAAGGPLTAAADQYAFCVSLRETLEHRGEVPRWLVEILARGTAAEPRDRYGSFDDLLAALARDPATVWRRRIAVAAVVAVIAGAFIAGSARSHTKTLTPCEGAAEDVARTWNASVRERVIAHLRGLGAYGAAEADHIARSLDDYGARWATAHRDACVAHERREVTDIVYQRQLGCLAKAQVDHAAIIDVLATVTADRLSGAIEAARSLPPVERCTLEALASNIVPPDPRVAMQAARVAVEIERSRVLAKTDDPSAVEMSRTALAHARLLGYPPLVARAQLANGLALLDAQHDAEAIPVLEDAALTAVDAFDDITFVEATARHLYVNATAGHATGTPDTGFVERVARRTGAAGSAARALLFNNLGALRFIAGDRAGARVWADRALSEPSVAHDSELLTAYSNRAMDADDPAERDAYFARAREAVTGLLGPLHRKTLDIRYKAAFYILDAGKTETELADVVELYRRYHASVASETIAACLYELGWLAEARGDDALARERMASVGETFFAPLARAHLIMFDGELAKAVTAAHAVAETYSRDSWAHIFAADAYALAASCETKLGRSADALGDLTRALTMLESAKRLSQTGAYQRRLARLRRALTEYSR